MAVQRLCDGTLKPVDNPEELVSLGPLGREYGPEAVDTCREYLAERDALHGRLVEEWESGLAALREKYRLPGKLPDE